MKHSDFFLKSNSLKLTQEELENVIYISDKEIKVVIKISPKRNLQAQMASIVNYFYSMWKIESIIILHKPFKRKEKLGIILNSFYTASILNTKSDKDITRKGSYTLISLIRKMQTLNKTPAK